MQNQQIDITSTHKQIQNDECKHLRKETKRQHDDPWRWNMKIIQQSKWDWQKLWTFIKDNASLPIEIKTKSNWIIIVKVPQS